MHTETVARPAPNRRADLRADKSRSVAVVILGGAKRNIIYRFKKIPLNENES